MFTRKKKIAGGEWIQKSRTACLWWATFRASILFASMDAMPPNNQHFISIINPGCLVGLGLPQSNDVSFGFPDFRLYSGMTRAFQGEITDPKTKSSRIISFHLDVVSLKTQSHRFRAIVNDLIALTDETGHEVGAFSLANGSEEIYIPYKSASDPDLPAKDSELAFEEFRQGAISRRHFRTLKENRRGAGIFIHYYHTHLIRPGHWPHHSGADIQADLLLVDQVHQVFGPEAKLRSHVIPLAWQGNYIFTYAPDKHRWW